MIKINKCIFDEKEILFVRELNNKYGEAEIVINFRNSKKELIIEGITLERYEEEISKQITKRIKESAEIRNEVHRKFSDSLKIDC